LRILVGLGNPGAGYERTRHNLGFRTLDVLAGRHGLVFGDPVAACAEASGRIAGVEVVLLKPQLYMNRSGPALARWARRRDLDLATADPVVQAPPLVVCDDIALPLGAARLRVRGGDGGHRGLESVIGTLGDEDFPRLRLGVAGGGEPVPPSIWADYVLDAFTSPEEPVVEELIDHAFATLEWVLVHGVEDAASRFNRGPPAAKG